MAQPKLTGDSVRTYLRDIGRVPLLEHDEEILLGRKVQRLMQIQEVIDDIGPIEDEDLAKVLGITEKELMREIKAGERAKDKMVTVLPSLVQPISQNWYGSSSNTISQNWQTMFPRFHASSKFIMSFRVIL